MRNTSFQWPLIALGAIALTMSLCTTLRPHGASADSAALCHFAPMGGVVSDSATRLSWQQNSAGTLYSWDEAASYCAMLDLHGTGWRLPSLKELHTLVDATKAMPAADPVAFPATAPDYYWTSSQVANFANEAWAVSFAYGYDGFFGVSDKKHVRCVR